jgi:serine protease inhibitor
MMPRTRPDCSGQPVNRSKTPVQPPHDSSDNAALQASLINSDPKVQLTTANSLWIDQNSGPVLPSFTQMDATYHDATVGDLAGAPANVNAWVDTETHGRVTELLPPGALPRRDHRQRALFQRSNGRRYSIRATRLRQRFTLSGGGKVSAELINESIVEHKTVVQADETGVVAAAAIGVAIPRRCHRRSS